jgi:hypothetical protein
LKGDNTCESIPYEAALQALARLEVRT